MKNSPSRLGEIIAIIKKYKLTKDITPKSVRLALEELGPTFVKMGQILSSRDDLIPKEYCNEFQKLKHSVKPMPYDKVEEILMREYDCAPSEIFEEINKTPVGSASIAQVHKAKLKTGEDVAIKIRRENIEQLMERDAKLLKKVINILRLNKIFGDIIDLTEVVDEMYNRAKEEMNFHTEKEHIEEFGENTIKLTGVPTVCIDLDIKELFLETLDEINTVARTAKQEKEEKFIATVACKAAVKANMALDAKEVESLMDKLLSLPNPFTCPHGRPTAIKMTKYDIERKFARK